MSSNIINEYKKAAKERSAARIAVVAAILGVLLIFGLLFYKAWNDFSKKGANQFAAQFQKRIMPIANQQIKRLPKLVEKLIPLYIGKTAEALDKNSASINQLMLSEWEQLEQYGQKQAPHFEEKVQKIIGKQEEILHEELARILGTKATQEQIDRIVIAYRIALEGKLAELLDITLKNHINTAESIKSQVANLATRQEFKKTKLDSQQLLGLGLELLGKDLQEIK